MSFKNIEAYELGGSIAKIEEMKNMETKDAMQLFKELLETFPYNDFSLENLNDLIEKELIEKEPYSRFRSLREEDTEEELEKKVLYKNDLISFLIKKKLLIYSKEEETYSINYDNSYVAQWMMATGEEEKEK